MTAEWTLDDAWILSAINVSRPDDALPLRQVIQRCDMIQHSIPNENEFTHAVARLTNAGLIEADADADRYWRTETGEQLYQQWTARYKQKSSERPGLWDWMDAIPPALRSIGDPVDKDWSLPAGVFDRAVAELVI